MLDRHASTRDYIRTRKPTFEPTALSSLLNRHSHLAATPERLPMTKPRRHFRLRQWSRRTRDGFVQGNELRREGETERVIQRSGAARHESVETCLLHFPQIEPPAGRFSRDARRSHREPVKPACLLDEIANHVAKMPFTPASALWRRTISCAFGKCKKAPSGAALPRGVEGAVRSRRGTEGTKRSLRHLAARNRRLAMSWPADALTS